MRKYISILLITCSIFSLTGCEENQQTSTDNETRDYTNLFSALPEQIIYPTDNPYSKEKEILGELLFWDPVLSGAQNVACASCHHPNFGWADGRAFSIGSDGVGLGPQRYGNETTPIHSPSIINMAFIGLTMDTQLNEFVSGPYFWDLRATTLEEQAIGPIKNPVEMLGYHYSEAEIFDELKYRLTTIPEYIDLFSAAFEGDDVITETNIAKALATFQRKVIANNSRFDLFLRGDISALSEGEIIGLNKFIDAGCADCHNGPLLSDNQIRQDEKVIEMLDAVRTPSLRNISQTAPYMQDGSQATLNDAISLYEDREDLGVNINEGDFNDIEVFLRTLSSPVYNHIPERVPSGLPVGGNIN